MDHAENPHVFITGDEDDDRRGTSLYCVYLRRGLTIRCSGANDGDRVATTFIRHYNIVFLNGRRRAHEEPREGDIPVEGDYRIARLLDIAEGERDGPSAFEAEEVGRKPKRTRSPEAAPTKKAAPAKKAAAAKKAAPAKAAGSRAPKR